MSSSNPQTLKSTTLAMVFSKYRSCCWNPTWLGCWLFVDHHLFGGKNKAIFTMKFGGSVISSHSKHPHIWLVKHLGPPTLGYTMGRFLPDLSPTLHAIRKDSRPGQITLLRVIPTLAFQVIYSDIYFDIAPNILSEFYLTSILIFYLAYLPAFYLVYILAFYLAYILAFYVAFFLTYILAFYVAFYVAYTLAVYLAYMLAVFLAYILAFHLAAEVQRCPLSSEGPRLRSSGAHWARKVPGWHPAVPTALRTLRLRSSSAHSDRKPAVEVQQCPLRAEVGEEIGEELARRKWTWKGRQRWWRRRRRSRRRRTRRRRRTTAIKSNNPHLAGGEKWMLSSGSKRTPVVLLRTCSKKTNLWDQI